MEIPAITAREQRLLAGLCSDLGPELLDVVVAPRGLDVQVGGVVLHDPADPPGTGLSPGDLVIGIGVATDDQATLAGLRAAGDIGVVAVVCKRRDDLPGRLIATAQEAGVALLATDPDVPWNELYDLVRAALLADAASEMSRTPTPMTGDLVALADVTAAAAGGPVSIEDTSGHVLAFSKNGQQEVDPLRMATILGRRVPDEWMRKLPWGAVAKELRETDGVVVVETPGTRPRRVIAIRVRGEVLGAIWLAGDPESLSPTADESLRQSAQIAALHLMRQRVFDDLERRVRGGMLRMLLRGEGLAEPMLSRLGIPADRDLVVVVAQIRAGEPAPEHEYERVATMLVDHLRAYRWQAWASPLDGRVYALVALHEGATRADLHRTIADCLARVQPALSVAVRAGIGANVIAPGQVTIARQRADQCLEFGPPEETVVSFEEVHGRAVLADAQAFLSRQDSGITPGLRRLLDHDRDRSTAYVDTLRAYFDNFGDSAATAQAVQIHTNTLRYRLRRIAELTDTDLTDADARLSLELQLRALRNGVGRP